MKSLHPRTPLSTGPVLRTCRRRSRRASLVRYPVARDLPSSRACYFRPSLARAISSLAVCGFFENSARTVPPFPFSGPSIFHNEITRTLASVRLFFSGPVRQVSSPFFPVGITKQKFDLGPWRGFPEPFFDSVSTLGEGNPISPPISSFSYNLGCFSFAESAMGNFGENPLISFRCLDSPLFRTMPLIPQFSDIFHLRESTSPFAPPLSFFRSGRSVVL